MPLKSCEDMGFDVNKDVSCIRKIVPELIVYQLFYEIYISIVLNVTLITLKRRDFGWFFFTIFFKSFRVSLHPSSVKLKHNYLFVSK